MEGWWREYAGSWFIVDSSLVGYDGSQYVRDEEHFVEQEQQPRKGSFIRELVPDWRPTRKHRLWTFRIVIVIVLLLGILGIIGWPFGITLWAWMKLLIVPAVIAAGGLWFNRQQRERELYIENQRAQDEALQAYLDKMSDLLVVHGLGKPQNDAPQAQSAGDVAWARTKTVLRRLDGNLKGSVLRFLYEADLIRKGYPGIRNISGADLVGANLKGSYLKGVILKGVNLKDAVLRGTNLIDADLGIAEETQRVTDLTGADLTDADLTGADLSKANLSGATISQEQLDQAKSLEGATMPDGQILKSNDNPDGPTFEEWVKNKACDEDGE